MLTRTPVGHACDAVLFDATGTLFAPHPTVGAVYADVAAGFGIETSAGALDAGFVAAWRERAPARFEGDAARRTSDAQEKVWWRHTVRRTFERGGAPDPGDACFEALFERFAQASSWRLFGDVQPALASLRERGLRLGVVSNFDSRLGRICDGLGLTLLLDFALASAEVGHAKPAREIFEAAVAAAGAAPERTLMVGESPDDDVTGAQAAGCQALLLDRGAPAARPGVIRSLAELAPAISR